MSHGGLPLRGAHLALQQSVSMLGFWAAIALPLSYLPLLTITPVATEYVLLLLASNVISLVVGHRYDPRADGVVATVRRRSKEATR